MDVDKQACHALAERGYRSGLWPESYVTWDFLDKYPKAMEPGYLHLNWNHIPGMYLRKYYLRTLVIEKEEWAHLSNPASLTRYSETFALALCQTAFHDCEDTSRRKEYIMLVAIVQKLARYMAILFSTATDEFRDDSKASPTLLLVWLHRDSLLFPDVYFDQYHHHFMIMHDSGRPFNVGHPQKFVRTLLHNAFQAGDKPSPKVKLPLAFLDHPTKFPIDSCIREYRDLNTDCDDRTPPDEHFVWLSNEFTPTKLIRGLPMCQQTLTLGLPAVEDWPQQTRDVPWILLSIPDWLHHLTTSPPAPVRETKGGGGERRSTISPRSRNSR